jgi:hypothetical protein
MRMRRDECDDAVCLFFQWGREENLNEKTQNASMSRKGGEDTKREQDQYHHNEDDSDDVYSMFSIPCVCDS